MANKTYELTESQRRLIHTITRGMVVAANMRFIMANISADEDLCNAAHGLAVLMKDPHSVDPEIEGRERILAYLHERGFKGRQLEAMMSFTWGPGEPTWARIMTKLNEDHPALSMLRVPNVGQLTVYSVMLRCIAHGWIRDPIARRNVDRWLVNRT